ncbi:VOC family protein [Actinocrispum sp. NPDC049592]|uniref:VOC family protein n=1 Tax=Actinocrispum sp. NPDC049592 TaxID=3154835 RepID=UPI00341B718D
MSNLRVGSIVWGVSDVARATAFWTAALDYVPREPGDETWVVLVPRSGEGPGLSLALSESPVAEHPRVHLDLYTADQAGEVERLVGLGAHRVDWDRYPPNADFVVLADPDGNIFCVIDKG